MSVLDLYRRFGPDHGPGRVFLKLRECRAHVRKESSL